MNYKMAEIYIPYILIAEQAFVQIRILMYDEIRRKAINGNVKASISGSLSDSIPADNLEELLDVEFKEFRLIP